MHDLHGELAITLISCMLVIDAQYGCNWYTHQRSCELDPVVNCLKKHMKTVCIAISADANYF